jgi:chromosome segregation ATPase
VQDWCNLVRQGGPSEKQLGMPTFLYYLNQKSASKSRDITAKQLRTATSTINQLQDRQSELEKQLEQSEQQKRAIAIELAVVRADRGVKVEEQQEKALVDTGDIRKIYEMFEQMKRDTEQMKRDNKQTFNDLHEEMEQMKRDIKQTFDDLHEEMEQMKKDNEQTKRDNEQTKRDNEQTKRDNKQTFDDLHEDMEQMKRAVQQLQIRILVEAFQSKLQELVPVEPNQPINAYLDGLADHTDVPDDIKPLLRYARGGRGSLYGDISEDVVHFVDHRTIERHLVDVPGSELRSDLFAIFSFVFGR